MTTPLLEDVDAVIAHLQAHPEEPFYARQGGTRLLVGYQTDEGDVRAYSCLVQNERHARREETP